MNSQLFIYGSASPISTSSSRENAVQNDNTSIITIIVDMSIKLAVSVGFEPTDRVLTDLQFSKLAP